METLVRLHRESEGEPFTGLKPADAPLEPGIRESDEALDKGSARDLADALAEKVRDQVRGKFERVVQTREHANENVERGREYVAAYVDFIHTVERLHSLLEGEAHGAHSHGME